MFGFVIQRLQFQIVVSRIVMDIIIDKMPLQLASIWK